MIKTYHIVVLTNCEQINLYSFYRKKGGCESVDSQAVNDQSQERVQWDSSITREGSMELNPGMASLPRERCGSIICRSQSAQSFRS